MRPVLLVIALLSVVSAVPTSREAFIEELYAGATYTLSFLAVDVANKMTVCGVTSETVKNPRIAIIDTSTKPYKEKDYEANIVDPTPFTGQICYESTNKVAHTWPNNPVQIVLKGEDKEKYGTGTLGQYYNISPGKEAAIEHNCPVSEIKIKFQNAAPTEWKDECTDTTCTITKTDRVVYKTTEQKMSLVCLKVKPDGSKVDMMHCTEHPYRISEDGLKIKAIRYGLTNQLEVKDTTIKTATLYISGKPKPINCEDESTDEPKGILTCSHEFTKSDYLYTACKSGSNNKKETLQDLNVDSEAIKISGDNYLSISFKRTEESKHYEAFYEEGEEKNVKVDIDCSDIKTGMCYGFLKAFNKDKFFTLQYKSEDGTTVSNTIHAKAPATGPELHANNKHDSNHSRIFKN